mmetsp:Transcript_43925/g.136718  ORF Transcript_43925/g.136718 Transcript_43925/m.136718 type:complete len:256 (+) Transcript_43925:337-1104(+)
MLGGHLATLATGGRALVLLPARQHPRVLQRVRGAQALVHVLADHLPQDVPQAAAHVLPWGLVEMEAALDGLPHRGCSVAVRAGERHLLAQHEIEHDAGPEDVDLEAVVRPEADLGGDVAGRPAPPRHLRLVRDPRGEAKVGDERAILGLEEHVLCLDVAVDDVVVVDVLEAAHHADKQLLGRTLRHRAVLQYPAEEVPAWSDLEGHRQPDRVGLAGPEDPPIADNVVVTLHVKQRGHLPLDCVQPHVGVHPLHRD